MPRAEWEALGLAGAGAFALLQRDDETVAQHRLLLARFHELALGPPQVELRREGDVLSFCSPHFVWGVCLDLDGEAPVPDDAFDLLPGIPYAVRWPADLPEPQVQRTGNDLVLAGRGESGGC